jgi:histidine decarboxylase
MQQNAAYLQEQIQTDLPELRATRSNALSNTVYFRHPGDAIVEKYSLATMELEVEDRRERFAHVIVMPHVSREVLTEFLGDLKKRPLS